MARRVRITVSGDVLSWMLHEGHRLEPTVVQNGLPPESKYVYCFDDPNGSEGPYLSLVFEHESFPDVKNGDPIPILCPVFTDANQETPWTTRQQERRSGVERRKRNG